MFSFGMLTEGLDDLVLDTGCFARAKAATSDSVLCKGRFIDFVRVNCSPGDESRDVFLVLTSMICLVDCSFNLSVTDLWGVLPLSECRYLHLFPYVHFLP